MGDEMKNLEDIANAVLENPAIRELIETNRRLVKQRDELLLALQNAVSSVPQPTGVGIGLGGMEYRWPKWHEEARKAITRATAKD